MNDDIQNPIDLIKEEYVLTYILWDAEEDIILPETVTYRGEDLGYDIGDEVHREEIINGLSDLLSNEYDFCVDGFDIN